MEFGRGKFPLLVVFGFPRVWSVTCFAKTFSLLFNISKKLLKITQLFQGNKGMSINIAKRSCIQHHSLCLKQSWCLTPQWFRKRINISHTQTYTRITLCTHQFKYTMFICPGYGKITRWTDTKGRWVKCHHVSTSKLNPETHQIRIQPTAKWFK